MTGSKNRESKEPIDELFEIQVETEKALAMCKATLALIYELGTYREDSTTITTCFNMLQTHVENINEGLEKLEKRL